MELKNAAPPPIRIPTGMQIKKGTWWMRIRYSKMPETARRTTYIIILFPLITTLLKNYS
jgi:hypothetical protein